MEIMHFYFDIIGRYWQTVDSYVPACREVSAGLFLVYKDDLLIYFPSLNGIHNFLFAFPPGWKS